jgi:prolyl-tRNA synthetase
MKDKNNNEQKDIGITTKKQEDMASWYEQVVLKSELADFSSVKGCMIIRPNGYSIWQKIQDWFNKNIVDATGTKNVYYPLFIPESFFKKEADHAEGFTPEVAWIDKELTKDGERLAIRPTSETIMYDSYSKYIRSYNDLPLKYNQWCNVVRWETQTTKLFLRSREFLWQEGHCVYETEELCEKDTINYINLYAKLSEELLAIPVIIGKKTEKEKFAGAFRTYTIESFMPDGKALQCGTSHNLGQGFGKAFGISFLGKDEKKHVPWQNSWGLSTRLIGAMVMLHSDDKGLVLPPKVASNKLVIIPILFDKTKKQVLDKVQELKALLVQYKPIVDAREEYTPGFKYNQYEMQGIPIRLEIGPRDIEKDQVVLVRRDTGEKSFVLVNELQDKIDEMLKTIQSNLLNKAKKLMDESIVNVSSMKELESAIESKKMAISSFCNNPECEDKIKAKTSGITIRAIKQKKKGKCIFCSKDSEFEVYFARAY